MVSLHPRDRTWASKADAVMVVRPTNYLATQRGELPAPETELVERRRRTDEALCGPCFDITTRPSKQLGDRITVIGWQSPRRAAPVGAALQITAEAVSRKPSRRGASLRGGVR
jgi:alkylhydroperoxidase family enzyme